MFFLSDLNNIEFARRIGSKDKTKRKFNLIKRAGMVALGVGGLVGASYLARKGFNSFNKVKNIKTNNVNPPKTNITVKATVKPKPVSSSTNVNQFENINDVKKNLNNPNHVWNFNNELDLITFKRGKDKKKRAKRMGRFGAKARIGLVGLAGGLGGGTLGNVIGGYGSKGKLGALIGAGLGATAAATSSYIEHKNNAYSPIGKTKWKNYKQPPRMYGISTDRLDLIGER